MEKLTRLPKWDKEAVKRRAITYLHRFVPITVWGPLMTFQTVRADLIGGFIVGVMIVPTCLSWASLANIPLSCGLTAALIASFSYGTFGQCASLSIGPVAEITTLLISISSIPVEERETTFQSLGVQVGILAILLSFVDGGKVIKTIFAKAVGDGYTCAAAILAICTQMKVMFNVTAPAEPHIQDVIISTINALKEQGTVKSFYCFLLFVVYCIYLILIKKLPLPIWIPHQLIVVVVSTLLTWGCRLDRVLGLAIVRDVPSTIEVPHAPQFHDILGLGPYTLTITMISFVQMYVIAQRVMPDIDPNAELFADGVTNFLCNIFSGMPVTNSFSCSAVLIEQNVATPLTAYAAGAVVLVTIFGLTRLGVFYYLPKQTLAAIVVASVWRLVDFTGPVHLWRYSKMDAIVWVVTFILTIFGGITVGVLCGVALSLVLVVLRIARPRAVSVGFNMTTFHYGDLRKDPELLVYPNILMWRFDAPLYFINMGYFQERLTHAVQNEVRPIDVVLVTCGKVVDIDSAALTNLPRIFDAIATLDPTRRRRIILTDIHGRLESVLFSTVALPIFVPEEHGRLTISQIDATGKFPVVFKNLEDAIFFAQRCISEQYGNVDTAPYPNVSFLTDIVVETAKMQSLEEGNALAAMAEIDPRAEHHHDGDGAGGAEDEMDLDETPTAMRRRRHSHDLYDETPTPTPSPQARQLQRRRTIVAMDGADRTSTRGKGAAADTADRNLVACMKKLKKISRYTPDRELIGVMGVIRHTELTPKQKKKIYFSDAELLRLAFHTPGLSRSRRSPAELEPFLDAVEEGLARGRLEPNVENWRRVLSIIRSRPEGLKIQLKPIVGSSVASFNEAMQLDGLVKITSGLIVVKWGGVLTKSGISQGHVLGEKLFARFFAAGDLPLHRLINFTRSPVVVATDEERVINTALVVMNALTQTGSLGKSDIILDDYLTKNLNPTAKRLLHEEYKYFEALLHIDSHAAAWHFFHIPGFRQLLYIPPLDRPLQHSGLSSGEDEGEGGGAGCHVDAVNHNDDSKTGNERIAVEEQSLALYNGMRDLQGGLYANGGAGGVGGGWPLQRNQTRHSLTERNYKTPLQVLQELEATMRAVVESDIPNNVLNVPLSNHETLKELRGRYESMLNNFLGAKRRSAAPAVGEDEEEDDEEHQAHGLATFAKLETTSNAARGAGSGDNDGGGGNEDGKETEGNDADVSDAVAVTKSGGQDEILDDLLRRRSSASSENNNDNRDSEANGRRRSALARGTVPSRPMHLVPKTQRTSSTQQQQRRRGGSGASASNPPQRYDVSDVSKLRDYTSYDIAYNAPLLTALFTATKIQALRVMVDNIRRISRITECMARVGENVLEGVNSSKRFIIGSLVSGPLMKRIHNDFRDFARMDERRGILQLLRRAQRLYIAANGGVEQDVRHVLKIFKRIGKTKKERQEQLEEEHHETPEERATRLRYPFLTLPHDAAEGHSGSGSNASSPLASRDSGGSCARFYFTSYLHVEGVLHCLFESDTVSGFSRPSKEDLEASMRLYMKHLIFKVFRRRNVSFTDAEVTNALRKLDLLFRSDRSYALQQRSLRDGLLAIYHSMYYLSMEVYLSLGDSESQPNEEATPIFTIEGTEPMASSAAELSMARSTLLRHEDERTLREEEHGEPGEMSMMVYGGAACSSRDPRSGLPSPSSVMNRTNGACSSLDRLSPRGLIEPTPPPSMPPQLTAFSYSGGGGNNGSDITPPLPAPHTEHDVGDEDLRSSIIRCMGNKIPSLNRSISSRDRLSNVPLDRLSVIQQQQASQAPQERPNVPAIIMTTPQAGRQTAMVEQMKNRVSSVTPMRRIHEGLSLDDFYRLIEEVENAIRSQAYEPHATNHGS